MRQKPVAAEPMTSAKAKGKGKGIAAPPQPAGKRKLGRPGKVSA